MTHEQGSFLIQWKDESGSINEFSLSKQQLTDGLVSGRVPTSAQVSNLLTENISVAQRQFYPLREKPESYNQNHITQLGLRWYKLGYWSRAKHCFRLCTELADPVADHFTAHFYLGMIGFYENDFHQAEKQFMECQRISKEHPVVHNNLFIVRSLLKDPSAMRGYLLRVMDHFELEDKLQAEQEAKEQAAQEAAKKTQAEAPPKEKGQKSPPAVESPKLSVTEQLQGSAEGLPGSSVLNFFRLASPYFNAGFLLEFRLTYAQGLTLDIIDWNPPTVTGSSLAQDQPITWDIIHRCYRKAMEYYLLTHDLGGAVQSHRIRGYQQEQACLTFIASEFTEDQFLALDRDWHSDQRALALGLTQASDYFRNGKYLEALRCLLMIEENKLIATSSKRNMSIAKQAETYLNYWCAEIERKVHKLLQQGEAEGSELNRQGQTIYTIKPLLEVRQLCEQTIGELRSVPKYRALANRWLKVFAWWRNEADRIEARVLFASCSTRYYQVLETTRNQLQLIEREPGTAGKGGFALTLELLRDEAFAIGDGLNKVLSIERPFMQALDDLTGTEAGTRIEFTEADGVYQNLKPACREMQFQLADSLLHLAITIEKEIPDQNHLASVAKMKRLKNSILSRFELVPAAFPGFVAPPATPAAAAEPSPPPQQAPQIEGPDVPPEQLEKFREIPPPPEVKIRGEESEEDYDEGPPPITGTLSRSRLTRLEAHIFSLRDHYSRLLLKEADRRIQQNDLKTAQQHIATILALEGSPCYTAHALELQKPLKSVDASKTIVDFEDLVNQQKYDEAIKLIKQAIAQYPAERVFLSCLERVAATHQAFLVQNIRGLISSRQAAEAQNVLTRLESLYPDHPAIGELRGLLQYVTTNDQIRQADADRQAKQAAEIGELLKNNDVSGAKQQTLDAMSTYPDNQTFRKLFEEVQAQISRKFEGEVATLLRTRATAEQINLKLDEWISACPERVAAIRRYRDEAQQQKHKQEILDDLTNGDYRKAIAAFRQLTNKLTAESRPLFIKEFYERLREVAEALVVTVENEVLRSESAKKPELLVSLASLMDNIKVVFRECKRLKREEPLSDLKLRMLESLAQNLEASYHFFKDETLSAGFSSDELHSYVDAITQNTAKRLLNLSAEIRDPYSPKPLEAVIPMVGYLEALESIINQVMGNQTGSKILSDARLLKLFYSLALLLPRTKLLGFPWRRKKLQELIKELEIQVQKPRLLTAENPDYDSHLNSQLAQIKTRLAQSELWMNPFKIGEQS